MKKIIASVVLVMSMVAVGVQSAQAGGTTRYTVDLCVTVNGTGQYVFWSACHKPDRSGPCGNIQLCYQDDENQQ